MSKLFNKIATGFSGLNKLISISINLSSEFPEFEGGSFVLSNGDVNFESDINDLKKEEILKFPTVLTIEGKGVLHKFTETSSDKIKLRNIIPNIKEEDFYINYTPNANGTWVSIVRKDVVSKILEDKGVSIDNIVDLYLGPTAIQWLTEMSNELPSFVGGSELTYQNNQLHSIRKSSEGYLKNRLIFGTDLEFNKHLSFIGALVSFSKKNSFHKNEFWTKNTSTLKDKKTFQNTVKLTLAILLLVFMGNMVFNQVLNGTYNEKAALALKNTDLVNQSVALQEEEDLRKEFIEKLGLEINPQFAVFSDEIGETVPQSIQLSRLIVNPLKKAIRKKKLIEFKKEIIEIGGFCKSSQVCNEWVQELRTLNWVKKIELVEFKFNKDNIGEFIIEVSY